MANNTSNIGFSYFSSQEYQLEHHLHTWFPALQRWGGSLVIFTGNFDLAIPEDVFNISRDHGLAPIIHFNTSLPSARMFNDCAFLLDMYGKWGAKYVILGDRPNHKHGYLQAKWHDDTLTEGFLDRFVPLANHALRIGLHPIMAPLEPGGDYWDCAFMALVLGGLKQRKLTHILDELVLSSYGYTFQKPLSWGEGGPERWPGSKPYLTPAGQEDQLGFHNYEWVQAVSQQVTGKKLPVIVLDAGRPGPILEQSRDGKIADTLRQIVMACNSLQNTKTKRDSDSSLLNESVLACTFNLETLKGLLGTEFSFEALNRIFLSQKTAEIKTKAHNMGHKQLKHYLLLPAYASGVSDVVLNKVRPLIKKYRPTVGFSLEEAACASKVSVFPDPVLFKDEQINKLRAAGCEVEILPESGIEIATLLQD